MRQDPDQERDVKRFDNAPGPDDCEPEPSKQLTHEQFHLHDPVVNEQIHSSSHSQRYRAKERQAFELYINGLIDAVPLEKLSHERVESLIKFAIQTW